MQNEKQGNGHMDQYPRHSCQSTSKLGQRLGLAGANNGHGNEMISTFMPLYTLKWLPNVTTSECLGERRCSASWQEVNAMKHKNGGDWQPHCRCVLKSKILTLKLREKALWTVMHQPVLLFLVAQFPRPGWAVSMVMVILDAPGAISLAIFCTLPGTVLRFQRRKIDHPNQHPGFGAVLLGRKITHLRMSTNKSCNGWLTFRNWFGFLATAQLEPTISHAKWHS